MKELTKAEEQVMRYLWEIERGFLKDIVDRFPEPKPAYTTVSTVVRVLTKKGFIAFKAFGKVHEYYPTISKSAYFKMHFKGLVGNFFNGSVTRFASFFTQEKELSLSELEEIKQMVDKKISEIKAEENA